MVIQILDEPVAIMMGINLIKDFGLILMTETCLVPPINPNLVAIILMVEIQIIVISLLKVIAIDVATEATALALTIAIAADAAIPAMILVHKIATVPEKLIVLRMQMFHLLTSLIILILALKIA